MRVLARVKDAISSRFRAGGSGAAVATIAGGTAVAQVLALGVAPLLTRIYSPEDFGVFAVLSAVAVTVGTVAAGRLDLAVPLPESEEDAEALVRGGVAASLASLLVGGLLVLVFGEALASAVNEPNLMPWLWVVPVAASGMAITLTFNQLALRRQRFRVVARRNIVQSVVLVLVQLALGLLGLSAGGLIIGFATGQLLGALVLAVGSGVRRPVSLRRDDWRGMRRNISRYRRFPLVLGPSGLLNVLGPQVPVLLLASFYGSQAAGFFGLTQRVLTLPVTLVGTAVAQVFLSEVARAARTHPEDALRLFRRASRALAGVGVVLVLVLVLTAPELFALVFGGKWRLSGEFARAMAVAVAAQLLAAPLSQTLIIFEKQGRQLAWDIARLVAVAAAVAVSVRLGLSPLAAIWVLGLVTAAAYCASWAMSRSVVASAAQRGARPAQGPGGPHQPESSP